MKIIVKIAKAELRNLFFSPIAWFVVFLFYFTLSIMYGKTLEGFSNVQEAMLDLDDSWIGFIKGATVEVSAIFTNFAGQYFFLFIPLLTMGMVNREISNGTIKLLYSSPVTTREIIFGKYLGIVLFNMLLVSIVAIFLLATCMTVKQPEYRWLLLSTLLGYFLLVNTYAAIGLFISCLTTYQIVAAVISFAVLYLLSVISGIWQQYDLIRDITYYLALPAKTGNLMRGLITSRDIIYFLLVIALFLGYAMIKLRNTQQPRSRAVNALSYIAVSFIIIILGYFSSRPGFITYSDVTNRQTNTLHPAIQETVKELDGSPLIVTLYTNLLGGSTSAHGMPRLRNRYVWEVWEPFVRFYPNTQLRYEYYYDLRAGDSSFYKKYPGKSLEQIAAIEAEMLGVSMSLFKTPPEIRKMIDLGPEYKRLVMQLEYKGKKTFLRTYLNPNNPWPFHNHFAAAFKRLTRDKDVRTAFVTGHYERHPFNPAFREYSWHAGSKISANALVNDGVDCDTISLMKEEIPADINLLVVADPKLEYLPEEQNKIIDYLKDGGNAVFYTDIRKQHILAPILQTIGVYPDNGMIVRPDKHESPHKFFTMLTDTGNYLAKEKPLEQFQRYGIASAKTKNEGSVNLSYQEIDGFKIEPVVAQPANDNIWIENGSQVMDSATPVFSAAEGDLRKPSYVIALKLSRKIGSKEQRIIVAGDGDFMSSYNRYSPGIGVAAYSWTLNNKYPIYHNFPLPYDRFLSINHKEAKLITIVLSYTGSGILLAFAIILLVRRKRK